MSMYSHAADTDGDGFPNALEVALSTHLSEGVIDSSLFSEDNDSDNIADIWPIIEANPDALAAWVQGTFFDTTASVNSIDLREQFVGIGTEINISLSGLSDTTPTTFVFIVNVEDLDTNQLSELYDFYLLREVPIYLEPANSLLLHAENSGVGLRQVVVPGNQWSNSSTHPNQTNNVIFQPNLVSAQTKFKMLIVTYDGAQQFTLYADPTDPNNGDPQNFNGLSFTGTNVYLGLFARNTTAAIDSLFDNTASGIYGFHAFNKELSLSERQAFFDRFKQHTDDIDDDGIPDKFDLQTSVSHVKNMGNPVIVDGINNVVNPNLTLTTSSSSLTEATIKILDFQTGDELSVDVSSFTGANDNFAGDTLTITGTGSVSDYESALRKLEFTRTENNENRLLSLEISLTDNNSNQSIQTSKVSVYTPLGNLKAQLNESNSTYISNTPFSGQSRLYFIEPDDSHYQAMGFSHLAIDGYYNTTDWIQRTLSMLRQDRDTISGYDLTEFKNYIGQDADSDNRPRYVDLGTLASGTNADNTYNLSAEYMLHPHPPGTSLSPSCSNANSCTVSQLIKFSYVLNSGAEQTSFITVPGKRAASWRYPTWIGYSMENLSQNVVLHKFNVDNPSDTSQGYVNGSSNDNAITAINGESLIVTEMTLISEWATVRDYFVNGSDTQPSFSDFNAIGYDAIDVQNVDELTERLSRLAAITPADADGHNYSSINSVASTYNKVMSYIDDNTSDKPTESEWQSVGFYGVTANNISAFETEVGSIVSVATIEALRSAIISQVQDSDNDGVALYLDVDDENPYSDYDNDGFNDRLESNLAASGLDPFVDNSDEWTKDNDGDHIVDIYNDITSSKWRMSNWLAGQVSFTDPNLTSERTYKLGFLSNYGDAASPNTVDLKFLRNSDAHYQFVAYLEHIPEVRATKLVVSKTLCDTNAGETCLTGANSDYGTGTVDIRLDHNRLNKVHVRYSNSAPNIGASLQSFNPVENTPYNKFVLVSLNWDQNSQTYKIYLDGQDQGSATSSKFESLHDENTAIGLVGLSQNGYAKLNPAIFSNTQTGVYGFSAIATSLDQTFVDTQATRFLEAVADVDNDGVWDKFDLDIDRDGVANVDELNLDNQSNPFSDTESRGVSDLLKLAIEDYYDTQGQSPPTINGTLLTTDSDNNYVADLWDHIKDDGRSRAAWAIEEWSNLPAPTSGNTVQHHPHFIPISLLGTSSATSPVTMDLSNIGDGDASFEFITYVEDISLWGAVSLFGVDLELGGGKPTNTQSTGQRFMLSNNHQDKRLGFEQQSKNGVSGESGANGFSRIYEDFSQTVKIQEGRVQHLALNYTQSTKSYDLYIDGTLAATIQNASNDFITAIKASNSQIGLRVESSSTGSSVSAINAPNDGIYGFAAYSAKLTQSEIQQRADAVALRATNSDEDVAYDSLDFNTSPSVATFSQTDYTYSENQGSFTLDNAATIDDIEDTLLASLTIELIGYDANQDSINLNSTTGLNINNSGGLITVTPSTGSTANRSLFENALRSLSYENSSEDPITTSRTIQVTTNDTQRNNVTDISLTVTSINDLPFANNSNVTVTEDALYTFKANDFGYSDEESIEFSGIIIETLANSGTLRDKKSGNDVAQGQTIARADVSSLEYQPQTNSTAIDSFTFNVVDNDGDDSISAATMTITIATVNDAPVIANINSPIQTAQDAQFTYYFNATDPDIGDTLTIDIINKPSWLTLDSANQQLIGQPSNNEVGSYTDIQLKVTDADTVETFSNKFAIEVQNVNDAPTLNGTPAPSVAQGVTYTFTPTYADPDTLFGNETKSFTIQNKPTWLNFDSTDGSLTGTPGQNDVGSYTNIEITVEDKAGATDTLPAFSITVNNVNDAPTGNNVSVTAVEDSNEIKFKDSHFSMIDIDGDSLSKIVITSVPADGMLTLSGSQINGITDVSLANLQAENLRFEFSNDEFGTPYTTFTFKYHDGQVESAADYTATINITAVEDQLDLTVTLSTALTEDDSSITVGHVVATYVIDNKGENDIGAITITPSLTYQVGNNNTITLTQDGIDTLNATGTLPAFTLSVVDNGTTVSTQETNTPIVVAVNDLPIAEKSDVTVTEDTLYTFKANEFNYKDEESTEFSKISIETLANSGTLIDKSTGQNVSLGQEFERADVANLQYQPQTNSTASDSFTFNVVDNDGDESTTAATMTITISSVNDAPSLTFDSPSSAFVKGDGSTALLYNVNIDDIDSTELNGATIILANATANESLALGPNSSSITSSYNSGTLTLTGNAPIADYQTALEAVQYSNTDPNFTSTTDETRSFNVTVTDVSADTTQSQTGAAAPGTLTLFGEFTNIQQYAASPMNPLSQVPTDAHYQALGFATNLDDGYFSGQRTALNNKLSSDNPSLADIIDLQAYIDTDTDKDGMRDYFDPNISLVNEDARYLLHPEIAGGLPYDANKRYSYLYKVQLKFSSSSNEKVDYLQVATWSGSDNLDLDYRWPRFLNFELNNRFSGDGLNATTNGSNASNTVSGIDWMELDYIAEWWTIIDFIIDDNNLPPELNHFAAIGIENVKAEHVAELRSLVRGVSDVRSHRQVEERSNSYVIIHDYALDSGNPITTTAPQDTDYTNIGLTQDVTSVSEFNAWLNDAQLTAVSDIIDMVDIINHAKNMTGAIDPAHSAYTQAGIYGVDAGNVDAIRSEVKAQGAVTLAAVQAIVDGLNGWNSVIDYAKQEPGSQQPLDTTYNAIGLTGLTNLQVDQMNAWLREEQLDDSTKITSAYNIITANNPGPEDYYNIGITPDLRNLDQLIIDEVLAINVDPGDSISDLQVKVNALDADNDGVTFGQEQGEDANPWSDYDGDNFSDKFESYFTSLDPLSANTSVLTEDNDGNDKADFWENELSTSTNGLAALVNQSLASAPAHTDRVFLQTDFLQALSSTSRGSNNPRIDLQAISGDASYDAILYIDEDLSRSNIEWLGNWAANKVVLKFEQDNTSDEMGLSEQSLSPQNFSFGVKAPYGRFVHLHYLYLDNPDGNPATDDQKYQLYIDNQFAGEVSEPFAGPVNYADTKLGLIEYNQSQPFGATDGIYAFSAYNSALDATERQALFDASQTQIVDSDGDGVWDTFDLNKHTPVAQDKTLATNEDASFPFSSSDFGMSDQDGDSLTSITITSLPDASKGKLQFNGKDVNVDDTIDEGDIQYLAYVPEQNVIDSVQFTYTAKDRANGNDSKDATITININPQNDPPEGQDFAFDINEDSSPATLDFTRWDAVFDDIDGDTLAAIVVTQLPNLGELKLNNSTISNSALPQPISEAQLRNGDFSFHFNNNVNGNPYTAFKFKVNDGIADSVEYTATLNILATEDDPQLTVNSPSQAFVENDSPIVVDSNLTIIDVDGSDIQSATVTIQGVSSNERLAIPSSSLPSNLTQSYDQTAGTLSVTGLSSITDYQNALRALTYQHTGTALGVNNRDITFTITDDTNRSNSANSATVVVLGFYENIAAFADSNNPNHNLAQLPINEHYIGAGLVTNTNGYFVGSNNSTTKVNAFLQSQWSNLSINNAITLSAALNAQPDNDKDGQPAYFDDDDTLFHLNSHYVLLPEIDQTLPSVTYDYLFSAKVQVVGQSVKEVFITHDRNAADAEQSHIWPKVIADAIETEFSSLGVNAFDKDSGTSSSTVSSAHRNVISGVQWIELSYIEQWQAINAYRTDATNTVTAPNDTDYNVISTTDIVSNQLNELNKLLRNTNPSDYTSTVGLIKSYDAIYEYALATVPITAVQPEMSDYTNIGINQNLNNTTAFNAWLNAAQLVNVDNINAMIEIVNFSNGIRIGGGTPPLAQYALAGITGTSTIVTAQLSDIEQELESSSQQTLAQVQAIFDKYNSWQALIDYANNTGSTPQPSTYRDVGFANLTGDEISQLNNWLREQTLNSEQKITSAVNIVTYFSGNNVNGPYASDYQNIGISKDVSDVISEVNRLTINKNDTIGALQASIDNIDFDNDSVAFVDDLDDTNPWTDFDQDGLNDKMETVLNGFDPLVDNSNAILNDGDGNRVADIWQQMISMADIDKRNKAIGYFINGQLADKASSGPLTIKRLSTNTIYSENWTSISADATYELVAYLDFSNESNSQRLQEGIFIQSGNMSLRFASEGKKQFAIRSDGVGDRDETTQTGSAHFFTATDSQSTLFPSQQYFHLALTFDSGSRTFTLYINGSEVGRLQDSSFTALNSATTKIGVHLQGIISGALTNYMATDTSRRNMVTHIQHDDAIWTPQTIQLRADTILTAIEDINQNGIWDAFDLDIDSDGLLVATDDDDKNSFSDKDSDGLNDQFETALSLDSISNDDSNQLTDDNGSRVAVLWDQVKVSPNAMASWINQTWSVESSNLDPIVTLTQPIAGYDNYVYPNKAKTVDLSALPSEQASYEFIVKITNDNFADVTLLGHHDTTDTTNATSLTFENSNLNTLGVTLNNTSAANLTNVIDDASPYGDIAHLVYVYEHSSNTYTIYINGQVAATAQSDQLSAIRSPFTPIGLFAKDSTGASNIAQLDSMDGIYAFAAYPTALAESDIQTLANALTSVTLDSDSDGVWDSFDLNKFIPVAADNSLSTPEDSSLPFTQGHFGFTDQDTSDTLSSINIINFPDPNRGQLLLRTTPMSAQNSTVTATEITNGDFTYQPVKDTNDQGMFEFSVSDGQNSSATAQMIITITPDNDAPVITNTTPLLNVNEDTDYVYQPQISDVDNTQAQLTVTLTGANWLKWDDTNQQVIGKPDNSYVGTHNMTLSVTDGDKSDDISWALTVDNTNDAPTGQDDSTTINEDTSPFTFAKSNFTFSDDDTGDSLENIIITKLPSEGNLELNGSLITSLTSPLTVTLAQLTNGELKFVFASDEFGANYSTFKFKLNDGEDDSAASYKFTVNIDNVEDDLSINIVQPNPIVEDDVNVTAPYTFANFSIDDKGENDASNIRLTNNSNGHFVLSGNDIQLTQVGINTVNRSQSLDQLSISVDDGGSVKTINETLTVSITPVNDAPTASSRAVNFKEDDTYTFTIASFSYSDEESSNLSKIKITQRPANGELKLNNVVITQQDKEVTYDDIDNGLLTYEPVANNSGTETLYYQVSDGQLWSSDASLTLNIDPVNDAPTAQASVITVDEDQPFTISYSDFKFDDPEKDALTKIVITKLPDQGDIRLDGSLYKAGNEIDASDINANKLSYLTAPHNISTTSLDFKVFDGNDFSNIATITINVNSINDKPKSVDHNINAIEDNEYTFSVNVIDRMFADDDNSDVIESLIIKSIPNNGVLKVNDGNSETVISNSHLPKTILRANISQLRYLNTLNNTASTSFTFNVNDGTVTSANLGTLTINISPQDDHPTAVDGFVDVTESTPFSSFSQLVVSSNNTSNPTSGQILYTDPDYDDDANAVSLFEFTEILLETMPTHGELAVLGNVLSAGDIVSAADIGNLTYTPGNYREDNTQFTFKLKSTDKYSQNTATMAINIQAINDAPTALASTFQVDEDIISPFTQSLFNNAYSDPEKAPLASIALDKPDKGDIYYDPSGNFNGSEVAISTYPQLIDAGDINQYAYKSDQNQDTSASMSFTVNDGNSDSAQATMTINVYPINDAPSIDANLSVVVDEDDIYTFKTSDITYSDPENDGLDKIRLVTLPRGELRYKNQLVKQGDEIDFSDISSLTFKSNLNDDLDTAFEFEVMDDDSSPYSIAATMDIDVQPVNDAPTITLTPIAGGITENKVNRQTKLVDYQTDDPEKDSLTVAIINDPNNWYALDLVNLRVTPTLAAITAINDDNQNLNQLTIELNVSDGSLSTTQTATVNITRTTDMDKWYSVITFTPAPPVTNVSSVGLEKANASQDVSPSDNVYEVNYSYISDIQTNTVYTDISATPAGTNRITVRAKQTKLSDRNIYRTLENDFDFSSDPVNLVRTLSPLLDFDNPLLTSDKIDLLNRESILSAINDIELREPVDITYQWQEHDGTSWQPFGQELIDYQAASGLQDGNKYRLQLLAKHNSAQTTSDTVSDESIIVTSAATNYDISFDGLSIPQQGITQNIRTNLVASPAPAKFTERKVTWQRVNSDNSLSLLTANPDGSYQPTQLDVGLALHITVEYLDGTASLISRSIITSPVESQSSSQELSTLANDLSLVIDPVLVSTDQEVALVDDDIIKIRAQASTIEADYQWQHSDDGVTWTPVSINADEERFTTTSNENGKYLRLQIILSLLSDSTIRLNPLYTNKTEKVESHTGPKLETLVLDFDSVSNTLALSERSILWLDKYQQDTSAVGTASYQWYRIPVGGDLANNAEEILNANDSKYTLDVTSDLNFEHLLAVTVNSTTTLYSTRTGAWLNSGNPTDNNQRERYFDVVSIIDGTTPLQSGQTVTAQLSGSSLVKDTLPPGASYQWQSRAVGTSGTWNNIGLDSPSYTLTGNESGQDVRVLVERSDASGAILPQLVSAERSVSSTTNPLTPWQVSLTQASEYVLNQTISVSHRDTSYDVNYEWYQLSTASDWSPASASLIQNANNADYVLQTGDVGYFIGVTATISDGNGNNSLIARQVTTNPVKASNLGSSDNYYLAATLSPNPIYQNSTLSYQFSLYKNNTLVDSPVGNVTAQWYLIDAPEHINSPQLWTTLNSTTLPNAANGNYVLLKLEYDEANLTKPLELMVVSDDKVQNVTSPAVFDTWYSVIDMTPSNPIDKNSRPSLNAANANESEAESDNSYSVDYHLSPSAAPSKQYTDLTSLLGDYPATDSVIVSATQYSGGLSRELSPRSFTFSSDFVYDIRHIIPALDYNIPLNTGDNVTLLNQTQVESQVSALDSSLTINYQWQSNDGSGWTNVGGLSQVYADLNTQLAPLVAGETYRLKLIATDNNQTSEGSTSDVTTEVQNNSVSYNIEFDDLAQPQEAYIANSWCSLALVSATCAVYGSSGKLATRKREQQLNNLSNNREIYAY
ncbi:tandem-95 repeat protein [Photobacterium leiognathi]|uniref:tandem-95 repeat protein n=1 Tax=Photobacterium leiognathi TaxID=553611 RepID=UPI00273A49E0|nr:tandem-95 repeat protein [Photobacterium leiognathi]